MSPQPIGGMSPMCCPSIPGGGTPGTPSFASLIRAIRAEEGLRALLRSPLMSTARCRPGGKSRRSAAARPSTSLSLMNSSTSSLLGRPMPPQPPARMAPVAQFPPPALTSRMRVMSSVDGSWLPLRLPHASTPRFTVGELLRKVLAALSPMPFALMKSSTLLVLGRPTLLPLPPIQEPPPLLPPRTSTRASLMRASNAAEGFRALERSPRASARRWTSGGHSLRSAAARSSTSFDLMKSSTSCFVGSSPEAIVAPSHQQPMAAAPRA
mmetsp:Transcript_89119/g.288645  ORF Transcript_89119/g.288645 Transcript_89119/m.288645 type:complete len:267 (-) Transcript_89119:36-836(-)